MNSPIIIGQSLNAGGSRRTAQALRRRDAFTITEIARCQVARGADVLDLCASGLTNEARALTWLVKTVQAASDTPLSLDSADPAIVRQVLPFCRRPPWLNVNYFGTSSRPHEALLLLSENPTLPVVAVCRDVNGLGLTADHRIAVAHRLAAELLCYGVPASKIVFDPVMLPASAGPSAFAITLATITMLRGHFPEAHILCAVGNYSYGLQTKGAAERSCAAAALTAGADVFLCNPARCPALMRQVEVLRLALLVQNLD